MTKQELLYEALHIPMGTNSKNTKAVKNKLLSYMEENGTDPQLRDAIRFLDIVVMEIKNNNFEACSDMAQPIFYRLANPDNWDFYDILILSRVLDYTETYNEAYQLSNKILDKLEQYKDKGNYKIIKIETYLNTILRMLRERHFNLDKSVASEELDGHFSNYLEKAMKIADDNQPTFNVYKEIAKIRQGLFYNDDQLTNDSFRRLRLINKGAYIFMEISAKKFHFLTESAEKKSRVASTIGKSIKKKRKEMGLTAKALSEAIGKTPSFIGQLEVGERAPSTKTLMRLCDFFDVTPNYFYLLEDNQDSDTSPRDNKMTLLNGYAKELSDAQLQLLINVARDLPSASRNY